MAQNTTTVVKIIKNAISSIVIFSKLASPAGLEPATYSLEDCCSIQLNYGEIKWYLRPDLNRHDLSVEGF